MLGGFPSALTCTVDAPELFRVSVSDERLDQSTAAVLAAALGNWDLPNIDTPFEHGGNNGASAYANGSTAVVDPLASSLAEALGALFPLTDRPGATDVPSPADTVSVDRRVANEPVDLETLFARPGTDLVPLPHDVASISPPATTFNEPAPAPSRPPPTRPPPPTPAPLPLAHAAPEGAVVPFEHYPTRPPPPPQARSLQGDPTRHTESGVSLRERPTAPWPSPSLPLPQAPEGRTRRPEPEPLSVATKLGVSGHIADHLLREDGRLFGTIPPRTATEPASRERGTRQALTSLLRQRRRLLLSVISVALGVGYLAGSLSLLQRVSNGLAAQSGAGTEPADLVIEGDIAVSTPLEEVRRLVPHSLADSISSVPGVAAVDARLEGSAVIAPLDGTSVVSLGLTERPLGIGWPSVEELNPYEFRGEGRPPSDPDEVVIDARSADTAGVDVGDLVVVASKVDSTPFTVVGIIDLDREQLPEGSSLAAFTPDTARRLFDLGDDDNAIAIAVAPDADIEATRISIESLLPPGTEVSDAATYIDHRQDALAKSFALVRYLLIGFAGLAVAVGAFTVANSMALLFDTRRRGFALIRLLGGSPSQLVKASLAESVIAGAGAGAVGLGLGMAVGWGIERAIRTLGQPLPVAGSPLSWQIPLAALGIGVGVTALSALAPARSAAAAPPVHAVTGADDVRRDGGRREFNRAAALILAMAALGAGVAGVAVADSPWMLGAALGAAIGIVAVLVPRLLSGIVRYLSGLALTSSPALARLTLSRSRQSSTRTAATTAALMIAVGVVVALTVLSSSFVTSIEGQVTSLVTADLVVDSGTFTRGGLPAAIIPELERTEGVTAVSGFRVGTATLDSRYVRISAMNGDQMFDLFDLGIVGTPPDRLGPDGIVVSTSLAADLGVVTGDLITVTWQTGNVRSMNVEAVFDSPLTAVLGEAVVDSEVLAGELSTSVDTLAVVELDDPGDEAAIDAVRAVGDRFGAASVLAPEDLIGTRAELLRGFGRVIQWMLAFTVVLALVGVANTLQLGVNERRREIGLIRAVGGSRLQTLRLILSEAAVMSVIGTVLGVALGLAAAATAVAALKDYGLDTFVLPLGGVALIAIAAILLSMLGAVVPALAASRIPVLDAIADRQDDLTAGRKARRTGYPRAANTAVPTTPPSPRRVESQASPDADPTRNGNDHNEDSMETRCYNCGNDPGDPTTCRVCGATQITDSVGMFSVQPKIGVESTTDFVEPDLAPPRPPAAPSMGTFPATPVSSTPPPQQYPPHGSAPPGEFGVGADNAMPSGTNGGTTSWRPAADTATRAEHASSPVVDDDIVDATVIEDDEDIAEPPSYGDATAHGADPSSVSLGSIFDDTGDTGSTASAGRSPFGQFANEEAATSTDDAPWSIDERDADDTAPIDHGEGPQGPAFSEAPAPGRDAFATSATSSASPPASSVFAPDSHADNAPPPGPSAGAAPPLGPDPHGLGAAAMRMSTSSREDVTVALSIAAATIEQGESVIGAVGGSILGTPSAVVATGSRVIVVSDRPYAPDISLFTLGPDLTVTGRHAGGVASLTIAEEGRSISIDQIRDVELAVEIANAIRTRSSGTEF